jgi:hypothetical protein
VGEKKNFVVARLRQTVLTAGGHKKIPCQDAEIARKIRLFIVGTTFFAILTQRCIITHHDRWFTARSGCRSGILVE